MAEALNPYMAHDGEPGEGAVLVFAPTAREARRLAWPVLTGFTDAGWIDVRAERLRDHRDYLMGLAEKNEPHVLDNPPCCPVCERWGAPILASGKGCGNCYGDEAEDGAEGASA